MTYHVLFNATGRTTLFKNFSWLSYSYQMFYSDDDDNPDETGKSK